MAQVLQFPIKKELPEEVKERLYGIAAEYVKSMDDVINEVCGDSENNEEYSEMIDLMFGVVVEGLLEAVGKLGES